MRNLYLSAVEAKIHNADVNVFDFNCYRSWRKVCDAFERRKDWRKANFYFNFSKNLEELRNFDSFRGHAIETIPLKSFEFRLVRGRKSFQRARRKFWEQTQEQILMKMRTQNIIFCESILKCKSFSLKLNKAVKKKFRSDENLKMLCPIVNSPLTF